MKNVLKSRIEFILLVLISIDFIYSGCCCKKKPSNDGSKTNLTSKPVPGPGNPPIKPEIKPPVKPTVVKLTQEDIKSAILNCIDTNDDNRTEITEQWEVGICEDGAYIIKFGLLKFTVASSEVGKLKSPLTSEQVKGLEGKIEMTRSDKSTNFTFSNGGKLKLGDLTKSLNLLDNKLKINKTEHLCVKVTVGGDEYTEYINLDNSLLYKIDSSDYICRASKKIENKILSYDYFRKPFYKNDGVWYAWDSKNEKFYKSKDDKQDCLDNFNTAIFTKEDIDKFTFTVLTE